MAAGVVTVDEVVDGAERLGLAGAALCVHASLRSFPRLQDGPATLLQGLLATGATVMVASMANDAFSIPAPPEDRPARNGIDYAEQDRNAAESPWPGIHDIYDPSRTEVHSGLGATSAYVAARPDRIRCRYPTGTFSAVGPLAGDLIGADIPDDVFGPLRELARRSGVVLLVGVSLTRMTLLHLAEIQAGRHPFIRWARGPDGRPVRTMGGECSNGFDRLAPTLAPIESRAVVGQSLWRAFPAAETLAIAATAIRTQPAITHCDNPDCIECADAIAGGPTS